MEKCEDPALENFVDAKVMLEALLYSELDMPSFPKKIASHKTLRLSEEFLKDNRSDTKTVAKIKVLLRSLYERITVTKSVQKSKKDFYQ